VRGYNGQNSSWYQAAVRQKARRIIAAGMTKEVTFEPVDGPTNNRIDDAYRAKYHGSPYLSPTSPCLRAVSSFAPSRSVFHNPINQGTFKTYVVASFLAFNPFVTKDLLAFG
jgi:Uncharacterized protein conserved in bacteria (DUF2255)